MADLNIPIYVWLIGGVAGGLLGLLLATLLFRSACDLVSVEPPGWLKSAGIVLLTTALNAPINFGINLAVAALGRAMNLSPGWSLLLAIVMALPLNVLLAAVLYMFLLRVRFLKGALIWVLQTLMGSLVGGVGTLLVIGVWTIVDGVRRL
jgi:hypothetical protein